MDPNEFAEIIQTNKTSLLIRAIKEVEKSPAPDYLEQIRTLTEHEEIRVRYQATRLLRRMEPESKQPATEVPQQLMPSGQPDVQPTTTTFKKVEIIQGTSANSDALFQSLKGGEQSMLESMLKSGVDPNTCDANDVSALLMATDLGNIAAMRLLLLAGADPDKLSSRDLNPAPLIVAADKENTEGVKLLLEAGANPNIASPGTEIKPIDRASENDNTEIVEMLLAAGADRNSVDGVGYTPLMSACEHGQVETVQTLVSSGADLNATDQLGRSALHIACNSLSDNAIRLATILLDAGCDINLQAGEEATTPLMIAAYRQRPELIDFLISRNADVNACDHRNGTALLILCERDLSGVLTAASEMFANEGAKQEAMANILQSRDQSALSLIKAGANVNLASNNGFTPIISAAGRYCSESLIQLLLESGANVQDKTKTSITPMHSACGGLGNSEGVKLLIDAGANINATTNDGTTPLMFAVQESKEKIVELLLEHKADQSKKTLRGKTVADYVKRVKNPVITKLFEPKKGGWLGFLKR